MGWKGKEGKGGMESGKLERGSVLCSLRLRADGRGLLTKDR
jgi:hypothetical protein